MNKVANLSDQITSRIGVNPLKTRRFFACTLLQVGFSTLIAACGGSTSPERDLDASRDSAAGDGEIRGDGDAAEVNPDAGPDASMMGSDMLRCDASTISITGAVDDTPFAAQYKISTRFVTDDSASHELPAWGRLSVRWHEQLAVDEHADGATLDLSVPFSDIALAGRIFCATSATTTRRADRYEHHVTGLAEARCPGTPVSGTVNVSPTKVLGTVDGLSIDEDVGRIQQSPGRFRVLTGNELILLSDTQSLGAANGKLLSGSFVLENGVRYCVGGGSFTRDTSQPESTVTLTLTNLSKLQACDALPAVGSLEICVADPWQLDRP